MTLEEIIARSSKQSRIEFLKCIVEEFAKDTLDFDYENWEQTIRYQCENFKPVKVEEPYHISYCNIQILDPYETKNGQAFCISVWIAESCEYNDNGEELGFIEEYAAFDWEE